MTLPGGKKSFSLHCSKLIPRGVTVLSLSGHQLTDNSVKTIFRPQTGKSGPSWPPNLRVICLISSNGTKFAELVQLVAECIVTVRVVRFLTEVCEYRGFWSVNRTVPSSSEDAGNSQEAEPLPVSCVRWDNRKATVIRAETLDQHGCEDTWFSNC